MSRNTWALIKLSKNFNVSIYRNGLIMLIISGILSLFFGLLISYIYLHEPQRDFYATSGIAPPVKLDFMLSPNMSSHPMLGADPPLDDGVRAIPQ